jgi:hypothetical protein
MQVVACKLAMHVSHQDHQVLFVVVRVYTSAASLIYQMMANVNL